VHYNQTNKIQSLYFLNSNYKSTLPSDTHKI